MPRRIVAVAMLGRHIIVGVSLLDLSGQLEAHFKRKLALYLIS
jgi:hypothetical protein